MGNEIICGKDYWPLIPDGYYEAQCIDYDSGFILGKARKVFLNFRIIDEGEYFGKEIFEAFNMPYDRKFKPGHKYYKAWVMVNGWRIPSRNAKMSPRLFLNKIFKIKTRTVKPEQRKGKKMPEHLWYSVVDYIEEVIASYVDPRTTPSP